MKYRIVRDTTSNDHRYAIMDTETGRIMQRGLSMGHAVERVNELNGV